MGQNFCPTRVANWIIVKERRTGEITPVLLLYIRLKAKAYKA